MNEYKYACLRKHFLPTLAGFICINTYSHVHLSSPDSWSLEETQPVLAHPELSGRVVNACFDLSASQRESSPKALWLQAEDAHADLCPLAPGLCPVSHCSNLGAVCSCVTNSFSWCPVPLQAAPLLVHVSSFAATSHKKKLYVIGGGPNGKLATDKTQCYDPSTNKWSLKSSMPVEAKCINAVSFRDRIYVVGGAMRALYAYSPLEDSWCLVTQLSHERASCGIAPCNNRLYITGGRDEKNEVIATVLCWDPEAQKLTEECVLPRGVSHHGSVTIRKSYTHIRRIVPGAVSVWLRKGTRCRGSTLCTCCPGSCH